MLHDGSGKIISLGRQVGRTGGEGSVYEVIGSSELVAKIYHRIPPPTTLTKLGFLAGSASATIQHFAAFPKNLLYEKGNVRGFVMPFVKGKEIHQLYSPRERSTEFPHAKWDFLLRVAKNLAAAFDEIHKLGVVIGDVNEGNVLVTGDALVKLIDCDSYQVAVGGNVVTCDVGMPWWAAPEIQTTIQVRGFRGLIRTQNHDRFSLAIMIFHLLFMGRHPFAGVVPGHREVTLEQAIEQYSFAFSKRAAASGVMPPPFSLPLPALPPKLINLFDKAFLPGSALSNGRPTAAEWFDGLSDAEQMMKVCRIDPSHIYFAGVSICPWCSIVVAGGPQFFFAVSIPSHISASAGIQEVWNAIKPHACINFNVPSPGSLPLPHVQVAATDASLKGVNQNFVFGLICCLVAMVGALGGIWIICVVPLAVGIMLISDGPKKKGFVDEFRRRKDAFDQSAYELGRVLADMTAQTVQYKTEFEEKHRALGVVFNRLMNLAAEKNVEAKRLQENIRHAQLKDFLDRQLLIRANINGIGPSRLATLQAYGFESAWDLKSNMNVPGIGDYLEYRLLEWRREKERQFVFNPNTGVPRDELRRLDGKMLQIKNDLDQQIREGAAILTTIGNRASVRLSLLEQQMHKTLGAQAQAKANIEALS